MSAEQACEKINMMLQQAQSDLSVIIAEQYFLPSFVTTGNINYNCCKGMKRIKTNLQKTQRSSMFGLMILSVC
jgi:hypothetical protein